MKQETRNCIRTYLVCNYSNHVASMNKSNRINRKNEFENDLS